MIEERKSIKEYPLFSAISITVLVGIFLYTTQIINLYNLLEPYNLNIISYLFIDFLIRFFLGTILILLIIPLLFKFLQSRQGFYEYANYLRIKKGISGIKSMLLGLFSAVGYWLTALIFALLLGVFKLDIKVIFGNPNPDTGSLGWFIFILALVPAIWEELGFRGVILSNLEEKYTTKSVILISGVLFGLFHFFNIFIRPLDAVILGVILATLIGFSWGYFVIKSNSILPVILSHYLIDSFGQFFINIEYVDYDILLIFFIGLMLIPPIINFLLCRLLYRV